MTTCGDLWGDSTSRLHRPGPAGTPGEVPAQPPQEMPQPGCLTGGTGLSHPGGCGDPRVPLPTPRPAVPPWQGPCRGRCPGPVPHKRTRGMSLEAARVSPRPGYESPALRCQGRERALRA